MKHTRINFKSGATSFYVVAISTLILVILATSFATAIMAEIVRSSNDDLAQSAYDSALAGIEEAKLAYENYRNCINKGITSPDKEPEKDGTITCEKIIWWMEHPDCDMVAHILGRLKDNVEGGEINLEYTTMGITNSEMDQAYTCAEIDVNPQDVYGSLSMSVPYKIINVDNKSARLADAVVLKWHRNNGDAQDASFSNIVDNKKVAFPSIRGLNVLPTPATISFEIVQTPLEGFTFNQLNSLSPGSGKKSNRATMYFVPTDEENMAKPKTSATANYVGIYDGETNYINASEVAKNNNHSKNLPYTVYCDENNSDFACSVTIELPSPIDDPDRNNDDFYFVLSLPYGGPSTDYSISYRCHGDTCGSSSEYEDPSINHQIVIDSTGRANDMYKRIEVRLDAEAPSLVSGFPFFAIQADTIDKNFAVNNEYGITDVPATPEPESEICQVIDDSNIMQNWDNCSCLKVGETRNLMDVRDNQTYSIAKLADNKCWMTKNLNIAGGTVLTPANSNVSSNYTLPRSTNRFSSDNNTEALFNTNGTNCSSSVGCYSYYTYPAVTAGTGKTSFTSGDAPSDICPKGWRLPNVGEFNTLISHYNTATKMTAAPFNAVYAGIMWGTASNPGVYNSGTEFSYWASTTDGADYGFGLYNSSNNQVITSHSSKGVAMTARCVKK